jgi:hypothetical protein
MSIVRRLKSIYADTFTTVKVKKCPNLAFFSSIRHIQHILDENTIDHLLEHGSPNPPACLPDGQNCRSGAIGTVF